MGHFWADQTNYLQDDSVVNMDGHSSLDGRGSAEQFGLDMVHLMPWYARVGERGSHGFRECCIDNVKQAHTVKKPKLCSPHARGQPWHFRKSDDPTVLGFQHRTLDSLWPGKKALQEAQAVPDFFSCKCLAVVWGPASGIPFHLEVKTH